MLEDEEGKYIGFFSKCLGLSAVLALFLAPMIPGRFAQFFLIVAVSTSCAFSIVFFWIRGRASKISVGDESVPSSVKALLSDDALEMFQVLGGTTVVFVVAMLWLGYAKVLWTFESFFVLFAGIHVATALVCTLIEMVAIQGDIDESSTGVPGTQRSECEDPPTGPSELP